MNRKVIMAFATVILTILSGVSSPATTHAAQWMYKHGSDDLTDKQYSFAAGFAFDYEYNNDFTVSFQCSDSKVRFEIDADTLITSKGKSFSFIYRVDKRETRKLLMRTYSNQNQGGYTYDNVQSIAKDILGGNKMFVRAITWDNDYLEAHISLSGSDSAIRKVFSDCNVNIDSITAPSPEKTYSLTDFTNSFNKLTPAQQTQILGKMKQLIEKY